MNKKTILLSLLLGPLSSNMSWADTCPSSPCIPLDKVAFQVSTKNWVSTQTALLVVDINVTLTKADLVQARADVMSRLNQIATGEWHLVQFDRSQDTSGLEKLTVQAQARIPQASLTDIYKNAKDVSKPGASYTINAVEFKPSLQEIQLIKSQMRQHLYQLVADELGRLNKTYSNQNYTVSSINIFDGEAPPVVQPVQAYGVMNKAGMASAAQAPEIAVSNELTMSAMVEAGSTRKGN
jgi:hypothetical protein